MRPTIRHHYRGTKTALWLDLIPKLHQSDELEPKYHLLSNYDNSSTFESEGTKDLDMDVIFPPPPDPTLSPPPQRAPPKVPQHHLRLQPHQQLYHLPPPDGNSPLGHQRHILHLSSKLRIRPTWQPCQEKTILYLSA